MYSLDEWRCIFYLNTKIEQLKSVEEALSMNDTKSWKISIDKEMIALKKNDR